MSEPVPHKFQTCDGKSHSFYEERHCFICDGGLAFCKVCNGAEGSLPTECPGVEMTTEQQNKVYKGEIDFRQGRWEHQ